MNSVRPGNGPKDWAPARPIKNTTLLTAGEEARLEAIVRVGPKSKVEEWLLELVRRISLLGPEEYQFPEYAALVNLISASAYAMRYARREPFSKETQLVPTTYDTDLMDWITSSPPCDAILFIRPFVRLPKNTPDNVREQVGKWRAAIIIDGEDVEKSLPLDDLLVKPGSIRKNPFSFHHNLRSLFPGCALDEQQQALRAEQYGVMLPNGSRVQLVIRELTGLSTFGQQIIITAGAVAASYTTKAL